jgi:large subunit ribosomal protein L1
MGTTRIKVIDLSSEQEQIKTSRKRAVKGLIGEIKRPLVEKKKAKTKVEKIEVIPIEGEIEGKIEVSKGAAEEEKITKKEKKNVQTRGKKYQNAKTLIDDKRLYPIDEALELLKKSSFAKFDASCEAHTILKQKGARGIVILPHGTGKKTKILVFAPNGKTLDGVIWGDEETIEKITKGELKPQKDFSVVLAVPDFMPKLAKVAKILGPRGLMPNPKSGTVITDPQTALKKFSSGQIEYKSEEKAPIIHTTFGKISFTKDQLKENILALTTAISLQRIKKLVISTTMGPGIKVDLLGFSSQKPKLTQREKSFIVKSPKTVGP